MTDTTITNRNTLQIGEDEIEAARKAYLKAYDEWVAMPTIINKQARDQAYDNLQHIQSLYRAGRAALIQKRVIERQ